MEQQGTRQTAECGGIMMRVARIQEGGDEKTDTVGGVYFSEAAPAAAQEVAAWCSRPGLRAH